MPSRHWSSRNGRIQFERRAGVLHVRGSLDPRRFDNIALPGDPIQCLALQAGEDGAQFISRRRIEPETPEYPMYGFIASYVSGLAVNWWFYARRNAGMPC